MQSFREPANGASVTFNNGLQGFPEALSIPNRLEAKEPGGGKGGDFYGPGLVVSPITSTS